MKRINYDKIWSVAPSWTSLDERMTLSKLAKKVPDNGVIVEIGALYGGASAVLALSKPTARLISIDNFSWTPEGYPAASRELYISNMQKLKITNFEVIAMTSKEALTNWNSHIDLLWIDGGHDFNSVYFDLSEYSRFSDVVALHDYGNVFWPSIRQAVEKFTSETSFYISEVVDSIVVLRRRQDGA